MERKHIINIVTEWDIVTARQLGRDEAKEDGFEIVDQARIATAISELAKNIYLYARDGEIIIERQEQDGNIGIAITAIDKGPGIADPREVLEDAFSTKGERGAGLPGVKRLMDSIEIQSEVGMGTKIRVEKWLR